jgi:hypothetical protein
MDDPLTFNQAMFSLADGWLLYWLYWLGYAIVLTPLILAFSKATRRDALIVGLTNIAVVFSMGRLYDQIGYVRLLGIVHVILWTPLFVYLLRRAWRWIGGRRRRRRSGCSARCSRAEMTCTRCGGRTTGRESRGGRRQWSVDGRTRSALIASTNRSLMR